MNTKLKKIVTYQVYIILILLAANFAKITLTNWITDTFTAPAVYTEIEKSNQ